DETARRLGYAASDVPQRRRLSRSATGCVRARAGLLGHRAENGGDPLFIAHPTIAAWREVHQALRLGDPANAHQLALQLGGLLEEAQVRGTIAVAFESDHDPVDRVGSRIEDIDHRSRETG